MRKTIHTIILLATFAGVQTGFGQSGPSSVGTSTSIVVPGGTKLYLLKSHPTSVNSVIPGANYNLSYLNTSNVRVTDFNMSGNNFVNFTGFDTIIFRRAANAWETTGGDKQHIFCEGPNVLDNTGMTLVMPVAYPASSTGRYMMKAIRDGYINRGSDNVFNNDSTSDLTYNNIERLDCIYRLGTASLDPSKAGFLITERGGNDPFKIAAITAIDASGNPTAFGPVLSVATSAYGTPITNGFTYVMRKDPADTDIRLFSKVPNQQIKSVFISFQNLGVAVLQKIYGYALMGNDVTATTSAQVLNYTNTAYFPRNTNTADGGIDMAAAPGIFHTNMILAGHFFELKYQKRNCSVVLNWMDKEYMNVKEYTVEKSYDQVRFEPLATFASVSSTQSYTDNQSGTAAFYRVKIVPRDGDAYYSDVIHVADVCGNGSISVYPNPVKDILTISAGEGKQIKHISLQGFNGTQIGKWDISNDSKLITLDVATLNPGQYMVVTIDQNNNRQAHKIVKK